MVPVWDRLLKWSTNTNCWPVRSRPGYVRGLQSLQDQVPPFDTEAARAILEAEWGLNDL
jgi:hypothetical protein